MKKQDFLDWIDNELNVIGYEHIEREIFVDIKRKVESGYFDKQKKSNREKLLDDKFEALGIKPYVYHFTEDVCPFNAITIAVDTPLTWKKVRTIVDKHLNILHPYIINRATYTLTGLNYGVALCDKQDNYNKRYGRMKAKGKLFQHLIKGKSRI